MKLFNAIPPAFERFRLRLASSQAGIGLALLGLLGGLLAGGLIVLFRLLIEFVQGTYIPFGDVENYEALPALARFCLPLGGAVIIGVWFQWLSPSGRRVGIIHVMERLQYHEGHLPIKNLATQFFAGSIALICGHSVGREAPSVHLGAATASLCGQFFKLPNNSIRTLVACGSAAAIAASFNTPLAGVIFAMEVVMMEYTIAGFIPVILAAVVATIISRSVFGDGSLFYVPQLTLGSMWDLVYILFMGICLGALSALFVAAIRYFSRLAKKVPIAVAIIAAGTLVGVIALEIPAVMGMGYDTVNAAILGDIAIQSLLLIMVAKLIASSACVAVGIPGGLIGPTIVMGAMVGGLFAFGSDHIPGLSSGQGLFVMLGMGAMMSAALQAPLAGLMAILELTANPHLILPAMLAVVSANVTAKEIFQQDSVFSMLMQDAGLDYRNDPISQSLRRVGVASVMNRNFVESEALVDRDSARGLLEKTPQWIIVRSSDENRNLLPAADLARFLEDHEAENIDLMEIPAHRREIVPIHMQASLQEARVVLEDSDAEAIYVRRQIAPLTYRTFGLLLRQDVESNYVLRR